MTISQVKAVSAASQVTNRIIDLTDSIPDITANVIIDTEHYQLPSDLFEDAVYQALNDLIDDFALNPHRYLRPQHHHQIDDIASDHLDS